MEADPTLLMTLTSAHDPHASSKWQHQLAHAGAATGVTLRRAVRRAWTMPGTPTLSPRWKYSQSGDRTYPGAWITPHASTPPTWIRGSPIRLDVGSSAQSGLAYALEAGPAAAEVL